MRLFSSNDCASGRNACEGDSRSFPSSDIEMGEKNGSEKYEQEGLTEINNQLTASMDAFHQRFLRSTDQLAKVGDRYINESHYWFEWPPIITHNFTNLFENLLPLRSPLMDLMFVLTVLLCLMIIRWVWVAFLECLEGLHVYCFPAPNIIHPDFAAPIDDDCCDQLPCKPIVCDLKAAPCPVPPCEVLPPPCIEQHYVDEIPCGTECEIECEIDTLDYVEELPCCPIPIETEPVAIETVQTEERVEISQPEETIQSTSLRSSSRSMRTVGVEHSIKMRNSQRTEHFEKTVVSN